MGWDKNGRYYTRSRRVNGRVVREYVGGGPVGEIAAGQDAVTRQRQEAERAADRAEQDRLAALDATLRELNDLADDLVRSALVAAGFRQHQRGAWRKRRGDRTETG